MGEIVFLDERGRLTIPKDAREKIGIGRLLMLEVCKGWLELRPVSDPIAKLEGTVSSSLSFKRMRRIGEEQLVKEAIRKFRRRISCADS